MHAPYLRSVVADVSSFRDCLWTVLDAGVHGKFGPGVVVVGRPRWRRRARTGLTSPWRLWSAPLLFHIHRRGRRRGWSRRFRVRVRHGRDGLQLWDMGSGLGHVRLRGWLGMWGWFRHVNWGRLWLGYVGPGFDIRHRLRFSVRGFRGWFWVAVAEDDVIPVGDVVPPEVGLPHLLWSSGHCRPYPRLSHLQFNLL